MDCHPRQSGSVADATAREDLGLDVTSRLDSLSERTHCAIWNSNRMDCAITSDFIPITASLWTAGRKAEPVDALESVHADQ
jgi:hypothetical protein